MTQEEAIEVVKKNWPDSSYTCLREALTTLIPELNEGEDEKIRKDIYTYIYNELHNIQQLTPRTNEIERWLSWLEKQKEQKPILEVFGFKVGDAVRLKDGDGRKHIIKSFEKIEGMHGPDFYHVVFEDNTASDHIIPGDEYPNGYFTCMEKIDEREEKKPADLSEMMVHKEPYIAPAPTPMVAAERKPISQEERNILEDIIVFISGYADKRVVTKWVSFLKSLRPQPKQEWSDDFDKEVEHVHKRFPEVSFAKLTRIAYHFSKWADRRNDKERDKLQEESGNIDESFEDGKKEVIANPEKYGLCDRKPAEWSEEDTCVLEDAVTAVDLLGNDDEYSKTHPNLAKAFRAAKDWLKCLPERFNLQPKQEWGEEDETAFGDLMWCIKQASKSAKDENDMGNVWFAENWVKNRLKSIRPQPKQEWSEEDEKIRQSIIKDIEFERNYTSATTGKVIGKYNEQINWLKDIFLNHKKFTEAVDKLWSNEWSEEDKKLLDFWLDVIDRNDWRMDEDFCKASREFINRIKSLRPSWRPTKTMLDALNWARSEFHPDCPNTMENLTYLYKELEQLYYDGN